jgi:predicted house-cleaning noncanonical NTP pyrophosphatase (MazG superfamily)
VEEALEVHAAARRDEVAAELADVLEVIDALAEAENISADEIAACRARHAAQRGVFSDRILLRQILDFAPGEKPT